ESLYRSLNADPPDLGIAARMPGDLVGFLRERRERLSGALELAGAVDRRIRGIADPLPALGDALDGASQLLGRRAILLHRCGQALGHGRDLLDRGRRFADRRR